MIDIEIYYKNLCVKLAAVYQEWGRLDETTNHEPCGYRDGVDRCLKDLNGILADHLLLCPICDAPASSVIEGPGTRHYEPCGHEAPMGPGLPTPWAEPT